MICRQCKKEFDNSNNLMLKLCSDKCREERKSIQMLESRRKIAKAKIRVHCEVCYKTFYRHNNKKYCSPACLRKVTNEYQAAYQRRVITPRKTARDQAFNRLSDEQKEYEMELVRQRIMETLK